MLGTKLLNQHKILELDNIRANRTSKVLSRCDIQIDDFEVVTVRNSSWI